ncbi:hypothetical protein ELAN_19910 [Elizabethkingia anophelis]|nr:hypothetical protein M876_13735 [Elizabethkingia anophelis FMS-007]WMC06521.1 MAG: hypothetical protein PQ275_11400 [Elizabethkingia anophelis]CDN75269.1 hypothetical protein E18064_410073 [Elizabethkingia anophelis]CDN76969.1 hypothetical protein E27107_140090 [Elizabethkingia anophelis]BBQ06485.1 hypothetical protein JUNP353_1056 [Elizabethkingia anophelis]
MKRAISTLQTDNIKAFCKSDVLLLTAKSTAFLDQNTNNKENAIAANSSIKYSNNSPRLFLVRSHAHFN